MARFEVKTPTPFYTGVSAGIAFAEGRAVVTSDTEAGLAALYYFQQASYGIAPLDEVSIGEVLSRANEDPTSEHARLTRENQALRDRLEIDELRNENKALQGKVFKTQEPQAEEPVTQVELLAPPSEGDGVSAWRTWAVESGRATEDEVKSVDKPTLISIYGGAYDRERKAQLQAGAVTTNG